MSAAVAEVSIFRIVAADKTHHRALFCQKSIFLTKLLYPNFFEVQRFMTDIWNVYGRDGRQLEAPNNSSMFYFSNRKRFGGFLKNDKVGRVPLMAITDVVRQSVTAIAIVNHNTSRFSIFSIWNLGYLVIHLSLLATMSVGVCAPAQCPHNVTQCPPAQCTRNT